MLQFTLTIAGTSLFIVGVTCLAATGLGVLDHYLGEAEPVPAWLPITGLTAIACSAALRGWYRRRFGLAAEAEDWLKPD